ncbi:unnamed protein product [Amoebophrya sp. A25]|nr:unnamed protein product [Amoebophrya sp. A25]|eukprot:GSA25T00020640001.1
MTTPAAPPSPAGANSTAPVPRTNNNAQIPRNTRTPPGVQQATFLLPPIGLTKPVQGGAWTRAPECTEEEKKVNQAIRAKYYTSTRKGMGSSFSFGSSQSTSQMLGGGGSKQTMTTQSASKHAISTSSGVMTSTQALPAGSHVSSALSRTAPGGALTSQAAAHGSTTTVRTTTRGSPRAGSPPGTEQVGGSSSSTSRFPLVPQPIVGYENFTLEQYEKIYSEQANDDLQEERRRKQMQAGPVATSSSSGEEEGGNGKSKGGKEGFSKKFERINVQDIVGSMERDMRNIREFKNFQQYLKQGGAAKENKGEKQSSPADDSGGERTGTSGGRRPSPDGMQEPYDANKHKSKQDIVMLHVDERRSLKPAVLAELQLRVPFLDYKTPGSSEKIELVDIRKLAQNAMCMGMNGKTPSLEQLMVAYRRKKKDEEAEANGSLDDTIDFLKRNKSSVHAHSRSGLVPRISQVEDDEWYIEAWWRRKYAFKDKIEHKHAERRLVKKEKRDGEMAILRELEAQFLASQRAWITTAAMHKFLLSIDEIRNSKELRRIKMMKRKKEKKEKAAAVADEIEGGEEGAAKPAAGGEESDKDSDLERAQRTDYYYSILFYATKFLRVLYRHRMKKEAMTRIIWLFRMVETSSAMKRAVVRFATTLRSIPVRAKIYLANKRKRNAEMEEQWEIYEDDMLEEHFKKMRAAVVREAMQARKKSTTSAKKGDDTMMEILEGGGTWFSFCIMLIPPSRPMYYKNLPIIVLQLHLKKQNRARTTGGVNWRQFRVPTHLRASWIQQSYIEMMLSNQRAAAQLYKSIKRSYMEQAQMVNFLRRMGVEEDEVDKAKSEMEPEYNPSMVKFWHLQDEQIRDAISKIINEHCREWVQHPLYLDEFELEKRGQHLQKPKRLEPDHELTATNGSAGAEGPSANVERIDDPRDRVVDDDGDSELDWFTDSKNIINFKEPAPR